MALKPQDKPCFVQCVSCMRCEKKNSSACPKPYRCSGRVEHPRGHPWPSDDRDDACRCREGILNIRLKSGGFVKRKFQHNPFKGEVVKETITEDERAWNDYVYDQREFYDDPTFDPLQYDGGGSPTDDYRSAVGGF